ncbi:MAG: hypothetical protein COB36_04155 [Alphaproteobacteria bacterium]|nr:MAG: hypothetical protein COB36_04155 [Alphaproteobacteria bacterium]
MKKIKQLRLLGLLSVLCLGVISTASFAQTTPSTPEKETKEEKKPSESKKKKKSGQFGKIGTKERTEIPDNLKEDANKIEWRLHKSITGVFDTKFPRKYKYKVFPFQFNKDTFASSAEIISALDGNVESKREKSMLVKVTQTFGSELTYREMKNTLERAARRYILSAKSIGGAVLTNKDFKHKGFFGKDIYISYKINDIKYGLRIRLYMTNFSKIEQVLSGPSHTMYSYRSDDFFETMTLYDGITTKKDVPMGYGWVEHTSKHNVFTVKLPPKNKDYTPFPPKFSTKDSTEAMRFIIVDPVTEERVKYNVYSYRNKNDYSYGSVKALIFTKHVSKFVHNVSADSLNIKSTSIDGFEVLKTKLVITPTDRYPGISTIVIEARYKDDIAVVQEFLNGKKHAKSGLDKTLFSLLKFHPDKYKTRASPKKEDKAKPDAKKTPPKDKAETPSTATP